MNKNTILITATLAAVLASAGCNKAGKLNQPSTFTTPTGPVELKLKWPAGERVVQNFDLKMTSEISMPNQPNPIQQDVTLGQEYALSVLQATANGGHELELEFLTMRMTVAMGGKTVVDYDSAKKPSNDRKDALTTTFQKTFQKIIGAKIQYFMDASNQVERIEGVDALMTRLGAGSATDPTAGVKNMFNEGYLKQMVDSSRYLPHKPVQPGDTWPVHVELALGVIGNAVLDYNFNLQNWEKRGERNCARLEFQGTMKSTADANSAPGGMTMSIQDGTASGVSWFDPELGLIIESDLDQDMKMIMGMPVKMRGTTVTQTMTNLMHQKITIKLESVK
jgi:hypothetical protein